MVNFDGKTGLEFNSSIECDLKVMEMFSRNLALELSHLLGPGGIEA